MRWQEHNNGQYKQSSDWKQHNIYSMYVKNYDINNKIVSMQLKSTA